ncbi:MAG: chromosomal replication initiator protein DnaA [Patescibacteria group bacterium]
MDKDQLWQATLGELELSISKANFTTWFKNTFISSYENDKVIIAAPNAFTKAWLEQKYHKAILKALQNVTGNVKEVIYKVENIKTGDKKEPKKEVAKIKEVAQRIEDEKRDSFNKFGINPKYTFESYVVGKANELAKAACHAVAEKPGLVYNPLFLYGGVGLGKTHLMQAIANYVLAKDKSKKILYVPSEKFTNEFIQSVSNGKISSFKDTYRTADVLLIDDIQFLAGKEGTQEEFFHTFNALHQANKQIVLSSDRPPKAIPALEQRLISRFEWGMIADIASPDLETRIAILDTKCREKGVKINREILNYIGTSIHSNVRELEGALNKIVAYSQLNNSEPDLEAAKNVLSSLVSASPNKAVTAKQLISTVASYFDISPEDLGGQSRKKELVVPRQIAMYLMRDDLKCSYPNIGQELGGRDHTTAMHAHSKIIKEIEKDEKTRQDINLIRQRLYS